MPIKPEDEKTDFSREYVEGLRQEAAGWRTKVRDLESQLKGNDIVLELARQGVAADPSWVQVGEGMTVETAVHDLVARYPHLKGQPTNQTPTPVQDNRVVNRPLANTPKAQQPGPAMTNVPVDPNKGMSLKEIKADPVARAQLRDRYRSLLKQASRQVDPTDY
jgi:hypothetical protein